MNNAGTDFTNLFHSPILKLNSNTDTFFSVSTSIATIPEKVLGVDIQYIRIAAALHQNNSNDQGAAWFDNLSLRTVPVPVPEPSAIALLAVGLAGLGFSRRTKA